MALKRTLSLTLLWFYGLGTILGAGVYALIGEVAKQADKFTPFSFLIASLLAFLTAISYAELSSRYPYSAGSALYIRKAFDQAWVSGFIGWIVVLTGVISAATISHGFARYVQLLFPIPPYISITVLVLFLGGLAIWGIRESVILIMLMTLIEIGGLIIIIGYGYHAFSLTHLSNLTTPASYQGIFAGAFIAFYAYIGFEDIVNTAEETVSPEKTLPKAIFLAVAAATILYLLVSWVIISILPSALLNQTNVPLVKVIEQQGHSTTLFTLIALISVTNGILVQIIMASRLIYGMAKQKNAPQFFSRIAQKTQTPVYSTLLVLVIILTFAYALPIVTLAKLTSTIMLCVFIMIHATLIKIKLTKSPKPGAVSFSILFPIISLILTVLFLGWGMIFSN